MTALEAILAVQERDTAIDRLRLRRQTLPERAELQRVEEQAAAVARELAGARERRDDVARRQAALEADLAASEKRIGEIDRRMYSGEVTAGRDLQAMAEEIESIRHRVSGLEDRALEAMEEREPLEADVRSLEERAAALAAEADRLRAAIAMQEADIGAEMEAERRARIEPAGQVPADLLATYERLRDRLGGVGAARLEHGSCTGCHLALPATEIDRLKRVPPEELVFCEQCGRILVR